jgi:hypothetical protein
MIKMVLSLCLSEKRKKDKTHSPNANAAEKGHVVFFWYRDLVFGVWCCTGK